MTRPAPCDRAATQPRRPPNVVLIVIDDLGWADLGCTGSSFYLTPRIDALAAQGTRYPQAYATAPVCSPTRASLLTGRDPARVGVTQWIGGHAVGELADVPYFHQLPVSEYTLARALRAGGYATWHVGKWHLGAGASLPQQHGFDINIGGSHQGHPPSFFSPYGLTELADGPEGEYLTDRLTDEAIALIDQHDQQRPFLLNLWHYAVHTPIQAPADTVHRHRQRARELGLDTAPIEPGEPMPTWHQAGEHVQRRMRQSDPVYAAMIDNLDANVGRLIDALEATDQLTDTMIIFTSDNGGLATADSSPTCNLPLREGKGWLEEGGLRVPLVVSWPGVVASGRVSPTVITSSDLYPTLLSAAGLDPIPSQHCDGVDLWADWLGETVPRRPVFWHYPHYGNQGGRPAAGVRAENLKLIRHFETGAEQLFDLATDPGEQHDLAAAQPQDRERLAQTLDRWLAEVEALIPQPNLRSHPDRPPVGTHRG